MLSNISTGVTEGEAVSPLPLAVCCSRPCPPSLQEVDHEGMTDTVGKGKNRGGSSLLHRFDLQTLPVDFVECLMRFLPTEAEVKLLRQYERERQPLEELTAEDRFMLLFSKVERLTQRMAGMAFLGNFQDNLQMLTPVRLSPESWWSTVCPPPPLLTCWPPSLLALL